MDPDDIEEFQRRPSDDAERWSDACPHVACPPAKATDAKGRFWRIVKTNPPTDWDFLSQAERGKQLPAGRDACDHCGVSVLTSPNAAEKFRKKFPYLGGHVVPLEMRRYDGVMAPDSGAHWNWWPRRGVNRMRPYERAKP